jgi:hypothetical protein
MPAQARAGFIARFVRLPERARDEASRTFTEERLWMR